VETAFQGSLFDEPGQAGRIGPRPLADGLRRIDLGSGAWIDLHPGWIRSADDLHAALLRDVPWAAEEQRWMYDRLVDVPRLAARYAEGEPLPHPVIAKLKADLDAHYAPEFGAGFASAGLALYRDGNDSVAWHGDYFGRTTFADTMVALVVLGPPRPFLLRPRAGHAPPGPTRTHRLAHGDLIVMGGSIQRTWQHAVPKTTRAAGPRISIQFRTGVD